MSKTCRDTLHCDYFWLEQASSLPANFPNQTVRGRNPNLTIESVFCVNGKHHFLVEGIPDSGKEPFCGGFQKIFFGESV